ncbi:seipin-like [Gigantopelta aegis]|uniref:seipin-like n=1 Tax=Gigantopelta aegis TaxID=1735272 RepID=UPI001B88AB8D|nr:seipin-like [Gigantopelta aegis]
MLFDLFGNIADWFATFSSSALSKIKYILIRAIILFCIAVFILWLSVFLYASFYYVYMPAASHVRPVYLTFNVCSDGFSVCSFPSANVSLGHDGREEILHKGQPYRIFLELDMPESQTNRNLGMFMIVVKLYDKTGRISQESSRTTLLHYRSWLLRTLQTIVLLPLYLANLVEQSQLINVEVFPKFFDDLNFPSVGALIDVQNRKIEIYSAKLKLFADFVGLRYFMFYWPWVTSICGVCFNFVFLTFVALVSWYHYSQRVEEDEEMEEIPLLNRRMSVHERRLKLQADFNKEQDDEDEDDNNESGGDPEETSVMTVGMVIPDINIQPPEQEEPVVEHVEHVHKSVSFAPQVEDKPVRFRRHSRVLAEDVAKF